MKKLLLIAPLLLMNIGIGYAQVWGDNNSRTEYRDNAGLQGNAGAISGFFQTQQPVNYPGAAQSWWNLLDVRHGNPGNNYAMQFAGSFFDQDLYFRKANNNASQAWSKVILATNGRVGIGTNDPKGLLEVAGDISNGQLGTVFGRLPEGTSEGDGTFLGVRGYTTQGNINNTKSFALEHNFCGHTNSSINFFRGTGKDDGYLTFNTYNNTERMRISPGDEVVIGATDSKGYKVAVAGSAIAESVTVKMNANWPDYVFQPSYHLPAISKVETFIEKNKHLPEMPSQAEVIKDGVNLGEMNRLLLKKVEELTLYLIEKDKKDRRQQRQIDQLVSKVKSISVKLR